MLKHVGKHNDRRAVILFREVPGDTHMCLVAYPELLPRLVHDEIMRVLESASGQQAENLADALFRNIMADGRNTLEVLHKEGFIKKVPTNQVIVQANAKSNVRLDELNSILTEMKQGQDAVQRLAELDSGAGMTGKRKAEPREVGAPANSRATPATVPQDAVLTDDDLAAQRITQAEKMKESAAQLLAEAERLMAEAAELNPGLKVNGKKTKVKAH
jgi:hypothetical protein